MFLVCKIGDVVDWGHMWTRWDGKTEIEPPFYARRLAELRNFL